MDEHARNNQYFATAGEFRQKINHLLDEKLPEIGASLVVYLAINTASKKWTMPIRHWKPALNRFMIELEEQLTPHI